MHEWQTALTGGAIALMVLVVAPARAEKDAAMKAREGEINHWIEYYRKDRELAPVSAAPKRNGVTAEAEKVKRKEEREKSEGQK